MFKFFKKQEKEEKQEKELTKEELWEIIKKKISFQELKEYVLYREFVKPYMGIRFDYDEVKELWRKVAENYPRLKEWLIMRKNDLLMQVFTEENKEIIKGAVGELIMIENLMNSSSSLEEFPKFEKQTQEEEKDFERIVSELKVLSEQGGRDLGSKKNAAKNKTN